MLRNLFLIVPFLLLVHVTSAEALPECQGSDVAQWHNCEGTVTSANGHKYVGEYRDGKRLGHGTFIWANGHKYVGEFRNDLSHGHGTHTYAQIEKLRAEKVMFSDLD